MDKKKILLFIGLAIALLLRVLKILPNFEIVTFMIVYIFSAFKEEYVANKFFVKIPFLILIFGVPKFDLINLIPFISYGFVGIVLLLLKKKQYIFGTTFLSVIVFFVVSNFLFWLLESFGLYTKDLSGLFACFAAAVPFLGNQLISNLVASVIFSLVLEKNIFVIRDIGGKIFAVRNS